MTEYTPTTDEVRDLWENSLSHGCANREAKADADWEDERMVAQFDRWLERVRAEAQVKALREAADEAEAREVAIHGSAHYDSDVLFSIRARADRIAREAGIETKEATDE